MIEFCTSKLKRYTQKKVLLNQREFRLFQPEKMLQRAILVIPIKNVRNSSKHFSVVLVFYAS